MKKTYLKSALAAVCFVLLFTGCPDPEQASSKSNPDVVESINSDYGLSRAENLDWIFNNKTLGKTTVRIKRSEWKTLCDDYRYFYKNENCVHAESYTYEKDGHKWQLNKGIGFRLRGNTSRYCPQGYDNGNIQGQMNKDWNSGYYEYANQPNDDYRQTHFKIDFEEFLSDDDEQKMAGCMKGVALKRMDESCTREIFCYDLFRKNGIWTAPRASHTRLILEIVEADNSVTTVDFGVYEMFEEVNKQSLKARESGKNNKADNAWKNNKGNLWKCCNDLTLKGKGGIGVEDIRIIKKGDKIPDGATINGREDGTRIGFVWKQYTLDLKTNKSDLETAKTELCNFIDELNALPTVTSSEDTSSINTIKDFYEKWFDVDFFLKTYAINIICGMDDDYWANSNNYYLYFGTDKNGAKKVYFIPFDYDNTLGHSINGDKDGTRHDPMDWGRGKNSPLMDKLLSVPEYKEKFKEALLEVCQNEYFTFERCSKMFLDWGAMVSPYINSPDLCYTGLGVNQFADWGTWNQEGCSLTNKSNNFFDDTRRAVIYNLTGEEIDDGQLMISQDTTYTGKGIKINIKNIPEDAAIRKVYLKPKDNANAQLREIANVGGDNNSEETQARVMKTDFVYAFTEAGKQYDICIEYCNKSYSTICKSKTKTITAADGWGEFTLDNPVTFNPATLIVDNKLKYEPEITFGNTDFTLPNYYNWGAHYIIEIEAGNWEYQSWNQISPCCYDFDFAEGERVKDAYRNKDIFFAFYFLLSESKIQSVLGSEYTGYGDYRLVIWTYDETRENAFKLK